MDAAGKQARYQYNGLGHRVGKQENVLPKEKLEKLDPQNRIGMEIGNSRQIAYTLDLTRQYYNLLERTRKAKARDTSGMGTWLRMKRMGNGTITFRMNWEARFGLRTVLETSGKAMDMEPLGKICIRTRGRYSRLDIRDTKGMRLQDVFCPGEGISGGKRKICRTGFACRLSRYAIQYEPLQLLLQYTNDIGRLGWCMAELE